MNYMSKFLEVVVMKILREADANYDALNEKAIAVIGYGAQGKAQALCMKDSGLNVIIGAREGGESWKNAKEDGFEVCSIKDASEKADVIHVLIPDEVQGEVYKQEIEQGLKEGNALSFSHGFNIVFGQIKAPEGVDVIMVAPKSPGTEERKRYLEGFGVPGLIAVQKDASGKAKEIALGMAKAIGLTRAGVLECTFEQETYEDLFGEQAVLCGGLVELMKAGFETLVEAGYPPEMAYFECVHEMKLIVDLVYESGIEGMNHVISNTAEWGERVSGPKVIDAGTKERMKEILKNIESGKFAEGWMQEYKAGLPNFKKAREEGKNHLVEKTGAEIRAMFEKKK
jgi:ketol-acid reductoisomerase